VRMLRYLDSQLATPDPYRKASIEK
jgi:hypothetical protein